MKIIIDVNDHYLQLLQKNFLIFFLLLRINFHMQDTIEVMQQNRVGLSVNLRYLLTQTYKNDITCSESLNTVFLIN